MVKYLSRYIFLILFMLPTMLRSQSDNALLISKMQAYEIDIQNTYNEYQKVYYERKSSVSELRAFEEIISVYVSQILEIYETLTLSSSKTMEKPRDIAARSLIFRALTYLEKAPLNVEFYEKACYDYYRALDMYNESDKVPVILKPLPNAIKVANKEYKRLIDLIDEKGKELYSFGKVNVILKNFKITSDLNAESFEFVRFNSSSDKKKYTYDKADAIIKTAIKEVLLKKGTIRFFLALPEGSYFIRSTTISNSLYPYLSAVYVRANQQQVYYIEPLVDWIIMYENPTTKQPNFFKNEQSQNSGYSKGKEKKGNGNGRYLTNKDMKKLKNDAVILNAIDDVVNNSMEHVSISKIFNLRDPWIRSRFANVASKIIASHILSNQYYNSWSPWMLAWDISRSITEKFSPGNPVPTELVQLVHNVLSKF